MNFQDTPTSTVIPTKLVGPIKMNYSDCVEQVVVPLSTFETPVWNSTKRGALVSQRTDGIYVDMIDDCMARSFIVEAPNLQWALHYKAWFTEHENEISTVIQSSSRFAKLKDIHIEVVGNLLYVRLSITTGNASGHNMVTAACDAVLNFVISQCENLKYVSISGNYCTDKKASAINGILGRGKRVAAEVIVPRDTCLTILKATPEEIVNLNVKKNLVGSILSGGVRTANAHFANILLAMYIATGQDAANIVEASQGITFASLTNTDLYFSVSIPNIIVGTVGNGKQLDFALQNLTSLKCNPSDEGSAQRLAAIIGVAVLCSELSLIAAQVNQGELMRSHISLERGKK